MSDLAELERCTHFRLAVFNGKPFVLLVDIYNLAPYISAPVIIGCKTSYISERVKAYLLPDLNPQGRRLVLFNVFFGNGAAARKGNAIFEKRATSNGGFSAIAKALPIIAVSAVPMAEFYNGKFAVSIAR